MNARIHERDQRYPQDKLLHAFCREFGLFLSPDFPSDIPTFVSHNVRTTIGVVLTNDVSLVESCIIQEQSVSSSPYNPIQFNLVCHFGKPAPSPDSKNGSDRKPAKLLWPRPTPTVMWKPLGNTCLDWTFIIPHHPLKLL